jgi:biopolymer transport protein ExbD
MAGSSGGESGDNPVGINVTAMVDVIFCLCIFFMCSLHFRDAEGRFETWLPKRGHDVEPGKPYAEMRVAMFWDEALQRTVRSFGQRLVPDVEQLQALIAESHADLLSVGQADAPLTIDADVAVPWRDVMDVINIGQREDIAKIEFALGAPPQR